MNNTVSKDDELIMKLLHYFITEQNYSPIVLQGAQNEIWLENLNGEYKIVRIVSNYIHNDEQFNFDLFRTEQIIKKIKQKTMSLSLNSLSIFTNLGESVNLGNFEENSIDFAKVTKITDLNKYDFIKEEFPTITNKTKYKEKGMDLFVKLTTEITKKSENDSIKAEEIFSKKKPIVTYIIIALNFILFLLMYLFGKGSEDNYTLIKFGALIQNGEYYRLISSLFLHIGIVHLFFNNYALYIIGPQIESFYGKTKYIIIYLTSGIIGNLLSLLFLKDYISAGASGAIFGLLGSLLFFGYHYRIYLNNVLKSQIIPLIIFNLMLGFILSGINNAAHIGGLIGGALVSMAVGIKHKSSNSERINGIILTIIFVSFLIYMISTI